LTLIIHQKVPLTRIRSRGHGDGATWGKIRPSVGSGSGGLWGTSDVGWRAVNARQERAALTVLALALLFEHHDFLKRLARKLRERCQIRGAEVRRLFPFAGLVVLVAVADGGVV